jgi:cytochrome c5
MFTHAAANSYRFLKRRRRILLWALMAFFALVLIIFAAGKLYQVWDDDPDRGAIGIEMGAFGESYSTPVYLDQGWNENASLWFYNTTQGSALIPYDFFLALEQADSEELFRSTANIDKFRYLPQKPTFFNPDGLPVGFAREYYLGKDYVGYTCAACHTGQINYQGQAIRIDGGPAMADMVGFLTELQHALRATITDTTKQERFATKVIGLENNYDDKAAVLADLQRWTQKMELYNTINHSHIDYGYARLDAFGRIYNRVLQHVLAKSQLRELMIEIMTPAGKALLTPAQVDLVLADIDETIIGDKQFLLITNRLASTEPGYPGLGLKQMMYIRDVIFNEPNAPVSYPFLWDITHSDYVQWNGLAGNAGVGPLGRNAGEAIGVFGILDWSTQKPGFSLSAWLTGQEKKHSRVDFKSSIDLVNLERLEAHLKSLKSPQWPEEILGAIDQEKATRGKRLYAKHCQSCHEIIERDAWDRMVIGKMSSVDFLGTDPKMARNSVDYAGKSGNFKFTYQKTDAGTLVLEEKAPVVQILTSVTTGVVSSPDPDKWFYRRWADWLYTLGLSFFDNDVKGSVKSGNYIADTTANPYNSLLAYKGRSLNGIWATAPYLHNGSVPSLYQLLLPKKRADDPADGEYRPDEFVVGSREFDPVRVGLRSEGYDGFIFRTHRLGDLNGGHEYGSGRIAQADGTVLPALTDQQRWDLVEFLKTL